MNTTMLVILLVIAALANSIACLFNARAIILTNKALMLWMRR